MRNYLIHKYVPSVMHDFIFYDDNSPEKIFKHIADIYPVKIKFFYVLYTPHISPIKMFALHCGVFIIF